MLQKMIQGTAVYDEIKIAFKGNLKQTNSTKIGKKIKSINQKMRFL